MAKIQSILSSLYLRLSKFKKLSPYISELLALLSRYSIFIIAPGDIFSLTPLITDISHLFSASYDATINMFLSSSTTNLAKATELLNMKNTCKNIIRNNALCIFFLNIIYSNNIYFYKISIKTILCIF